MRNLHTEQTAQYLAHTKPAVGNTPTCTIETSRSQGWYSCATSQAGEGRQPHHSAVAKCYPTTTHLPKLESSLLMPGQSHLLRSPWRGSRPRFGVALNCLSAVCRDWVTLSNCQLISIITEWHTLYAGLISLQTHLLRKEGEMLGTVLLHSLFTQPHRKVAGDRFVTPCPPSSTTSLSG